MSVDIRKALTIKIGTVKRTCREYETYLEEEVKQRAHIDTMKKEGRDEADIKKQLEVLNDTLTVLPDTRSRLFEYVKGLQEYLEENYKESATLSDEDREAVVQAQEQLTLAAKWTGTLEHEDGDQENRTGGTGEAPNDEEEC
mmetsp:Transcript_83614/g.132158  ORF Transcript_83614/g.132158 Transcript_83614/m.132158 type:complete len:142 (-) Transcript_83614:72-497(-)|eukprot:CAMPEP_0169115090 /NCGR_PEP_ID=MMETSP1015-20121227/29151_1 /TAXON_ID=342587 /ORGANISM="Karlodinium micrum, Strain CCMP2283" /LENGTH=141 /DNA_ID=CAMNT_0009177507 /DNA_START=96 /DNA_END=521 /DNA_ORIENTATION=+